MTCLRNWIALEAAAALAEFATESEDSFTDGRLIRCDRTRAAETRLAKARYLTAGMQTDPNLPMQKSHTRLVVSSGSQFLPLANRCTLNRRFLCSTFAFD